ncbi:MAG: hypothetical protein FJ088_06745, partial [Deltaproteobacteria bacterium]|nr:hypothetical protein [Deltaproteobacteria bacterium]
MNANTIAIVISIFSIWSLSACCDYKCKLKEKPPVKTEEEAVGANTFSLEGTARNAALGAVIVMDKGTPIYIEGLAEWPADFLGKRVKAKGILRQKKLAPDPMV